MKAILVVVCALLAASCATTGPRAAQSGSIKIYSSGTVEVNGRTMPPDSVGTYLKRRGFDRNSSIRIQVPEDVSPSIMKTVTVSLTNSGYMRVMFIKPKQASSAVKTDISIQ